MVVVAATAMYTSSSANQSSCNYHFSLLYRSDNTVLLIIFLTYIIL